MSARTSVLVMLRSGLTLVALSLAIGCGTDDGPPPCPSSEPGCPGYCPSTQPGCRGYVPPADPIVVTINSSGYYMWIWDEVTFAATVTGGDSSASRAVNWSVVEGSTGGSVGQNGHYQAPPYAGVYNVEARSVDDPSKFDRVPITVKHIYCNYTCQSGGRGNGHDLHQRDWGGECEAYCDLQCGGQGGCYYWQAVPDP